MSLSLAQTQALSELAGHLYDYLPGSSRWAGTYTFAHAARDCGVPELWQGGSKLPALTRLLEGALESRKFCPLVERFVREGIKYRIKKGHPLTRPEIELLNELVRKVGFRIPSLMDTEFLDALPSPEPERSQSSPPPSVNRAHPRSDPRAFESSLLDLKSRFFGLDVLADRQAAGQALEGVLNQLFALHDLEPGKAFRVVGEQIDGSFILDNEVYLLEAKWTKAPVDESALLAFRGKIEGKSSLTRGLFVSIGGFSEPALTAITRGKQPTFVMMDGVALFSVLDGRVRLDRLLRMMVRRLAERGEPYAPGIGGESQ